MNVSGCWRAKVVAENDPELRGRVRVRVPQLYADTVPDNLCPWAELSSFGGASPTGSPTVYSENPFGDLPNYHVGDLVWVMFEGDNPNFPVVIGGVHTQVSYPPDMRSAYANSRQRWRRQSRTGAIVEFDERENSFRINLLAGNTQVELHQTNDTILIKTTGGVVNVISPQVNVRATDVNVQTQTAELQASGAVSASAQTISVVGTGSVSVEAGTGLNLMANGVLTLTAPSIIVNGLAEFSVDPIEPGE